MSEVTLRGVSALTAAASEVFDVDGFAIKSRSGAECGPPNTIDGFTIEEIHAELALQGGDINLAQDTTSALFSLHRKRNLRNAT